LLFKPAPPACHEFGFGKRFMCIVINAMAVP
jgi:hypothetical protein